MLYYNNSELEDWNRKVPLSVSIAKSFRNQDGPSEEKPEDGKADETKVAEDPFANLDLDNLPEEARENIVKAKEHFAKLQTDLKVEKSQKEAFKANASKFQSEADRHKSILQKHNLLDGDPNRREGNRSVEVDDLEAEMVDSYMKMGIEETTAKNLAKVQAASGKVLQQRILKEVGSALGPTVGSVGNLTVRSILQEAEQHEDYAEMLQVPEIKQTIHETLQNLAAKGVEITPDRFEVAFNATLGQYYRTNKGKMKEDDNGTKTTFFGGSRGSGGPGIHVADPQRRGNGKGGPIAQNRDTADAMEAVVRNMKLGLPKKGR